jgi:D-inositol-3-phosphate glycosyltransferase
MTAVTDAPARIAFVGPVPPISSGIAQHGGHLADALKQRAEVEVLSWQHQYPRLLFRQPQRDPNTMPYASARFVLRWWDPISWLRVGWKLRRKDIAVLVWVTPVHAVPYRVMMLVARGTTFVAMAHNALPHEKMPAQERLIRWILGRCTGIVTHSNTVADELAELVPSVPTVTTPLPPQVEVERTPLPPRDGEGLHLLFFGFVRPYKGLDVAVSAIELLRARGRNHRLTVVGQFWEPVEKWQDDIARRGLGDVIELRPGYVTDREVSGILAAHDALLLPYRSASQSGVVPAALAAGRPVVATNVAGIAEAITDGVNGTLAAPGDAASLADAIERCAADLAVLAERTAETKLSYDDVADAVLKAAGDRHPRP